MYPFVLFLFIKKEKENTQLKYLLFGHAFFRIQKNGVARHVLLLISAISKFQFHF